MRKEDYRRYVADYIEATGFDAEEWPLDDMADELFDVCEGRPVEEIYDEGAWSEFMQDWD